jgi:hypothetical protein
MQKKEWQDPELIVLVRGKPEEAVLSACKGESRGDPNNMAGACNTEDGQCFVCEGIGVS